MESSRTERKEKKNVWAGDDLWWKIKIKTSQEKFAIWRPSKKNDEWTILPWNIALCVCVNVIIAQSSHFLTDKTKEKALPVHSSYLPSKPEKGGIEKSIFFCLYQSQPQIFVLLSIKLSTKHAYHEGLLSVGSPSFYCFAINAKLSWESLFSPPT